MRLGFDIENTPCWDAYDWTTDSFFLVDIIVNFRTCFADDQQVLHTHSVVIARQYLRGWFGIDFVSTVPLDRILQSAFASSANGLKGLKMIRILRLFRIAKLVKMLNAQSENSEEVIPLDAVVVNVLKVRGCKERKTRARSEERSDEAPRTPRRLAPLIANTVLMS